MSGVELHNGNKLLRTTNNFEQIDKKAGRKRRLREDMRESSDEDDESGEEDEDQDMEME